MSLTRHWRSEARSLKERPLPYGSQDPIQSSIPVSNELRAAARDCLSGEEVGATHAVGLSTHAGCMQGASSCAVQAIGLHALPGRGSFLASKYIYLVRAEVIMEQDAEVQKEALCGPSEDATPSEEDLVLDVEACFVAYQVALQRLHRRQKSSEEFALPRKHIPAAFSHTTKRYYSSSD